MKNNQDKFPDGYIIFLEKDEKEEVIKNFDNLSSLKFSPTQIKAFNENNNKLYSAILVMQYLLRGISQDLSKEMECDIEKAFNALSYNEKLKQIVENCSGYSLKKRGTAD